MFKNHLRQFESLFAMWPHAYCNGIKHMQAQPSMFPSVTNYVLSSQILFVAWTNKALSLILTQPGSAELGKVKSYTLQVIKIVPIPSADKDTRMMISTSPWNCVCVSVCCILAASLTVVTRAGVPHWPGVPALQRSHHAQYSTVQCSTVQYSAKCQVSPHCTGEVTQTNAPGHLQTPGYGTKWRSTGGGRRHF